MDRSQHGTGHQYAAGLSHVDSADVGSSLECAFEVTDSNGETASDSVIVTVSF